jgi:CheY-like chemotaxis protein
METNGRAALRYLPAGVVCEVVLPPASMAPSDGARAPIAFSNIRKEKPKRSSADLRVLVVEDSFMIVSALELAFDSFGWTMVGPATRIPEALALVNSESFDAALLDVNLDGEMSWDVAAALKARGIPFMLSTGYEIGALLPDFLQGIKFVRKPFKVNELEQNILDVIAAGASALGE